MGFLSWVKAALFPNKCLICFEEGAVLCASHCLETTLMSTQPSINSVLDRGLSVTYYQNKTAQQLIKKLKFSRQRSAAALMVEALFNAIDWEDYKEYVLVPMPLHWRRRYQRGFNQSLILAQGLSDKTGLRHSEGLVRVRATAQQARLGKLARVQNMQQVFKWSASEPPPTKVILIDDVFTTGATASAAALTLKKAGAREVMVITFAFQSETVV